MPKQPTPTARTPRWRRRSKFWRRDRSNRRLCRHRAEYPRARTLRRIAKELGAPRYQVAEALEKAALAELRARHPERVLETNVEFWAAIVLDFAQVPAHIFPSMFTAARTAGWSAHILEQKKTGRLIRPSARYIGPGPRKPQDVQGWDETVHALHN